METTKFTKVHFTKNESKLDYATEDHLLDTLKLISAKSRLPITELLAFITNGIVDTISGSREDTNFHFFAMAHKNSVSIVIKESGIKTMEFKITKKILKKNMSKIINPL